MAFRFGSDKIRIAGALAGVLVLAAAISYGLAWTQWHSVAKDDQVAEDDQVTSAITRLKAGDAPTREAAKEELLKQGSTAVGPLIAALEELSLNPKPHFDLGNEAESARALRRHDDLPVNERDPSEGLMIDITWRLKTDMIELLGRLHDKTAVPLLIKLTAQEMHTSQNEYLRPPMKALVEIGESGVPDILDAVKSVRSDEAETLSNCCPNMTGKQRELMLDLQEEIMVARLAIVLGEIRDPRALPTLQELIAPPKSRHPYASLYVKQAIENIENGPK